MPPTHPLTCARKLPAPSTPNNTYGTSLQGVEVYDVPGDHLSLLKPPYVQVRAERLAACVESARGAGG